MIGQKFRSLFNYPATSRIYICRNICEDKLRQKLMCQFSPHVTISIQRLHIKVSHVCSRVSEQACRTCAAEWVQEFVSTASMVSQKGQHNGKKMGRFEGATAEIPEGWTVWKGGRILQKQDSATSSEENWQPTLVALSLHSITHLFIALDSN